MSECKHPYAVEDGYSYLYHCGMCEQYVDERDIHFDVARVFQDEEDNRIIMNVSEEQYVDETWLGISIQESNWVDGETSCYINLSEEQVIELSEILQKHIHNMNMKHMKKYEEENNG